MSKRTLVSLAAVFIVLTPVLARAGQNDSPQTPSSISKKIARISGTVASDAKTFVSDAQGKIWTIANPDAVRNYEGRHVTLRANLDRVNGSVNVKSVRIVPDQTYHASMDDAAFRR